MLLSIVSTVAYAEDSVKNDNSDSIISSDKEIVIDSDSVQVETVGAISGTCGSNLTWTLDDEGTLTISGTGEMEDYISSTPWYSNRSNIKTVVIHDGVTSVGDYAFNFCSKLSSVTIPDSVTTIGDRAFYYCQALTSVTIGNSVTSIGESAFYYCQKLTSITIPDSVTIIGYEAFGYCDGGKHNLSIYRAGGKNSLLSHHRTCRSVYGGSTQN